MTAARDAVLGRVRRSLGRDADRAATDRDATDRSATDRSNAERAVAERLSRRAAGPVPERGRLDRAARIALFIREAERVDVSIDTVADAGAVPGAVAAYLAGRNLPASVAVAPDPDLAAIPWDSQPTLATRTGAADPADPATVTGAFRGVAETGTLILQSGPRSPTGMNFLPDTHIVVMNADRLLGTFEEAWADLRAATGDTMPRAVNWITGPSRSADIEQTLLLGAHGPKRLHLVLIDEQGT